MVRKTSEQPLNPQKIRRVSLVAILVAVGFRLFCFLVQRIASRTMPLYGS
jgi:hypothetical protein